ncbi:olfactory receptor 5AS1-like [Leptodactylus fuscus]|uniref:olfactory receptor 5AS1-like n=1 Tax=Leptodactylus fuscus TaxID=238119 RepID=UPI003F4EB5DC
MCEDNQTTVTEIFLIGFQNIHKFRVVFFSLAFLMYMFTFLGNLLIILLVSYNYSLHRPMYFFISNLSLSDLILTTTIIPNMLAIIWSEGGSMSIYGCIYQYYFLCVATFAQCCTLLVMSFDRYLAICFPLRYSSIMDMTFSIHFVLASWAMGIVLLKIEVIMLSQLQFCSSNIIDHFFCDFAPLLALSSSEVYILVWFDFAFCIVVFFFPFVYIIVSYICIFIVVFKMSSRRKAFSTCISHLLVVCIYYSSLIAIYISPSSSTSFDENRIKSLFFVMLTPFTNPIIYSMRNKEIIETVRRFYIKMKLKP